MNPNIGRDFIGVISYHVGFENTLYLVAKLLFGLCFAYCTNFVPDEFWQSTEVAYQMAFGKGHLTWEWMIGIRNSIVPLVIAFIYKLGSFVGLTNYPFFLVRFTLVIYYFWYRFFCVVVVFYSFFFVVFHSTTAARPVVCQGFNALLSILRSPNGV